VLTNCRTHRARGDGSLGRTVPVAHSLSGSGPASAVLNLIGRWGERSRRVFPCPLLILWTLLLRHMSAMDVGAVNAPTIRRNQSCKQSPQLVSTLRRRCFGCTASTWKARCHLVQRHASRGDEVDGAKDRRHARHMDGENHEIHGDSWRNLGLERRVQGPTRADAVPARMSGDEQRD
jgi:hypothetical protein